MSPSTLTPLSIPEPLSAPTIPWLDAFTANPDFEFSELISGHADIAPYHRLDTPDAAWLIFRSLAKTGFARTCLGEAIVAWLIAQIASPVPADETDQRGYIREINEVFAIIAMLDVTAASTWCFNNQTRLMNWVEPLSKSPDRDAKANFLQMLKVTKQPRIPHPSKASTS